MKEWYAQGALKPLDFVNFDEYAANTPPGFADAGKAPTASSSASSPRAPSRA